MTDKQRKIEELKSKLKPSHEMDIKCIQCEKVDCTTTNPWCSTECRDLYKEFK